VQDQEISTSGSAKILRNNFADCVRLKDFSMYLKWSEIGDLQIHLLQVGVILVSVRSNILLLGN